MNHDITTCEDCNQCPFCAESPCHCAELAVETQEGKP